MRAFCVSCSQFIDPKKYWSSLGKHERVFNEVKIKFWAVRCQDCAVPTEEVVDQPWKLCSMEVQGA